jgi:hypothetical protein
MVGAEKSDQSSETNFINLELDILTTKIDDMTLFGKTCLYLGEMGVVSNRSK